MSQPEDVSVSGDGNTIAVADTGNNRVRLYTIKGQQLSVIGMRGKGNGQFDLPLAVLITPANLLVVGERNNARLQVGHCTMHVALFDDPRLYLHKWRTF